MMVLSGYCPEESGRMKTLVISTLMLVLLFCSQVSLGQGVIVPQGGFADTVVTRSGEGSDIWQGLYGVPADDNNKWNITLFVDRSQAASQQVEAMFSQDANLRAIAAWGHYNALDINRLSQAERFRVFQAAGSHLPILCVYPPKDSQTYPYQYVVRKSGADLVAMGARDLAVHVVTQIRGFAQRIIGQDCVGPWCPLPLRPRPQPTPTPPTPYPPSPDVMPPLPNIPDVPDVSPQPQPQPDNPLGPSGIFPDYALITIIVDPHGLGERIKAKGLEMVIERVAAKYSGFERPKARVIRLNDPEAKMFPVGPADTPAAVLTHRGRIVGYVTGLVLDVLRDNLNLPTPLPDNPTVVVDNSGVEAALREQAKLSEEAAESSMRLMGLLTKLAALIGVSVPAAALILVVGGYYVFKKRGGFEGYRGRRERRLNWVHSKLPPRLARRTRRIRNRIRKRFGRDALPDGSEEMMPEELEELEEELKEEEAEELEELEDEAAEIDEEIEETEKVKPLPKTRQRKK
jgi:hypothetical protein